MFATILLMIKVVMSVAEEEVETTPKSDRFCRNRNRPITSDRDDLFNFVEAVIGGKIMLQCYFCDDKDDGLPKNWFKMDQFDDYKRYEVTLGMENNMIFNRIHLDMEHTLIINNVSEEDGGEYFCKGLENEDIQYKYNFFVDVVLATDVPPETGNLTTWKKYHDENYIPINALLKSTVGPAHAFLKIKMQVDVEVVTEWDPPGRCEVCGRPKGDGRRKTNGHCRLKIIPDTNKTVETKNYNEKMLLRASHLSCRSVALYKLMPDVMAKIQVIPDFVLIEKCDGICNPDAEGKYKGWETRKKFGFKYRKTFVLAENAHLTLICPDSTLENKVVWKFNNRMIKPGQNVDTPSPDVEPRVTVDSFNTLYLYGVTSAEQGNYTCHVDDVPMQTVQVFVVSKAKLLTQAFVRHMMYLGFVLSLTLSCYCAGLVITCTRKHRFKTYKQVVEELKKKQRKSLYCIDTDDDLEMGISERKKLLSSSQTSLDDEENRSLSETPSDTVEGTTPSTETLAPVPSSDSLETLVRIIDLQKDEKNVVEIRPPRQNTADDTHIFDTSTDISSLPEKKRKKCAPKLERPNKKRKNTEISEKGVDEKKNAVKKNAKNVKQIKPAPGKKNISSTSTDISSLPDKRKKKQSDKLKRRKNKPMLQKNAKFPPKNLVLEKSVALGKDAKNVKEIKPPQHETTDYTYISDTDAIASLPEKNKNKQNVKLQPPEKKNIPLKSAEIPGKSVDQRKNVFERDAKNVAEIKHPQFNTDDEKYISDTSTDISSLPENRGKKRTVKVQPPKKKQMPLKRLRRKKKKTKSRPVSETSLFATTSEASK